MTTKRSMNQKRYRTMRSAILTGSVLSFLPLFVLMKSAAGDTSTSVDLATAQVAQVASSGSSQGIATASGPTQTASSQNTASQTSSSATKSSATTYTRTKAS